MGVLIINTNNASADKANPVIEKSSTGVMENATQKTDYGFFSSTLPSMFKLAAALAVVLVAIYVGIYLLKKMMGRKYTGNRTNNLLEVLETTYVAPKKTVSLIRVADKAVLIGVAENNISILSEIDSVKTKEMLASIEYEPQQDNFTRMLKTASQKLMEMKIRKSGKTVLEN